MLIKDSFCLKCINRDFFDEGKLLLFGQRVEGQKGHLSRKVSNRYKDKQVKSGFLLLYNWDFTRITGYWTSS